MKPLLFLLMALVCLTCVARIQPEEGLWDDPNKPGRGVTLEFQNGVLVATYFGYSQDGEAHWWQGVAFEGPDNTYSGTFNAPMNGQCIGCAHQPPVINPDQIIGDFTIEFFRSNIAELTWADGAETIYKNTYGVSKPLDYALGAWTFNGFTVDQFDDYGVTINNVVFRMDQIIEVDGELYASGNYSGFLGANTFPVLAKYIGEYSFPDGTFLPSGYLISFVYQANLNGTNFMRFDMIVNEDKAEGVMTVFDLDNIPPAPGGNYNGFLRAAGARYIDQYEKENLFPIPLSKQSSDYEKLNLMTTMFPSLE